MTSLRVILFAALGTYGARAVLADAQVLVLDEPTAHLDTATANAAANDLLNTRQDRTIIWITHGQVGLDQMDEVFDLSSPKMESARLADDHILANLIPLRRAQNSRSITHDDEG